MTKPQSHRRPPANQRPPLGRVGHCPLRDASPDRETLSWIHFRKHSGGRRGKERREKRKEEKKRTTRRDDIFRCARTSSGEANGLWTLRGHPIPSRLDIHCTLPPDSDTRLCCLYFLRRTEYSVSLSSVLYPHLPLP